MTDVSDNIHVTAVADVTLTLQERLAIVGPGPERPHWFTRTEDPPLLGGRSAVDILVSTPGRLVEHLQAGRRCSDGSVDSVGGKCWNGRRGSNGGAVATAVKVVASVTIVTTVTVVTVVAGVTAIWLSADGRPFHAAAPRNCRCY